MLCHISQALNPKSKEMELICLIRKQETNHKAVSLTRIIEELILRSCSGRTSFIKVQGYILGVLVGGRQQELEYLFGSVKIGKNVSPGLAQNTQAHSGLKMQY